MIRRAINTLALGLAVALSLVAFAAPVIKLLHIFGWWFW